MPGDGNRSQVRLLITDLDNTLWDWFAAWYASFNAMVTRVAQDSGVPLDVLLPEIRRIHQSRRTSEYSLLLAEIPSLLHLHHKEDIPKIYNEAIHEYRIQRKRMTTLYPGVAETLGEIKRLGVPIVGYTESLAYFSEWRIRHVGLDGLLNSLFSSPDHDFPEGQSPETIRTQDPDSYGLKVTRHRHTPHSVLKPNPIVLRSILDAYDTQPSEAVYIGDSLMKDVAMAQAVGVHDVHAAYGLVADQQAYDLLRNVSHWTEADVLREKRLATSGEVHATVTLTKGLPELLDHFQFRGRESE